MSDNRYYVKRPMRRSGQGVGFYSKELIQALHLVLSQIFIVESLEQFPQLIGREPV
jgi:hypothetical protein